MIVVTKQISLSPILSVLLLMMTVYIQKVTVKQILMDLKISISPPEKDSAWWIMGTELISKAGITASSLLNLSMLHIHFGDGKFIIPALP